MQAEAEGGHRSSGGATGDPGAPARFRAWLRGCPAELTLGEAAFTYLDLIGPLVDAFYSTVVGVSASGGKNADTAYVLNRILDAQKRLRALLADLMEIGDPPLGKLDASPAGGYFLDQIADECDTLCSLVTTFSRLPSVNAELGSLGQAAFVDHLLGVCPDYVLHLADQDDNATPTPHTALGTASQVTTTVTSLGLSLNPPKAPVAKIVLGAQAHHRGLPILVIPWQKLPVKMLATIVEIVARQGVCGAVFDHRGRSTEPKGEIGLRSVHQNEMGLLPVCGFPKRPTRRFNAYHQLCLLEKQSGMAGRQQAKEIEFTETCLYEFNAPGIADENTRLIYDYANDRFFLTFHYKLLQVRLDGTKLSCVGDKSKDQARPILMSPKAEQGTAWISGMFLIDLPPDLVVSVAAPQIATVETAEDQGGAQYTKKSQAARKTVETKVTTFPGMPLLPAFDAKKDTVVGVEVELWKTICPLTGLVLGGGSEDRMLVYEKVRKSYFDFHLTCVGDDTGSVVQDFHLAVRITGSHGAVVYWWYRLVWSDPPRAAWDKPKKDATFDRPTLVWKFAGPVVGHGAQRIDEIWDEVTPYAAVLDGLAVLTGLVNALIKDGVKVRVVKKVVSGRPDEIYYRVVRK